MGACPGLAQEIVDGFALVVDHWTLYTAVGCFISFCIGASDRWIDQFVDWRTRRKEANGQA